MDIQYLIKNKETILKFNKSVKEKIFKIHGAGVVFGFISFFAFNLLAAISADMSFGIKFLIPLFIASGAYFIYSFFFPTKKWKSNFLKDKPSFFGHIYNTFSNYRGFLTLPTKIHFYVNALQSEFTEKELEILDHEDIEKYTGLIYENNKRKFVEALYQYIKNNKIGEEEQKEIDSLINDLDLEIDKDKYDLLIYKNNQNKKENDFINTNKNLAIKSI
tara:strand:+ start:377 stop:1030 length:654 start_codon:yes stop_codon:yes gene_type:complete